MMLWLMSGVLLLFLGFLGPSFIISLPVSFFSLYSLFDFVFLMDKVSLFFLGLLFLMVYVMVKFSNEYMGGEIYYTRFMYILYSFIFSMVVLIISSKAFFLLLGWDGLGVTSFLLICFYKTSVSWSSSLKTFLINRLGDGFLLISFAFLYYTGSYKMKDITMVEGIFLFFLIAGCFTKSAQFPFSSWLPAAMAAPTPVSALVHSSTLVTAGMYLIIRFYYLLEKWVFLGMSCFSLFTVFMASLAACSEMDMKKVMAFSTLSQLGVMGVSLSMGLVKLCLFHLMIHAMFKANMFICAGYFLMKKNHNQDLRLLKKLQSKSMLDITLLFSLLNLKGVCYLAGFYSKDSIFDVLLWGVNYMYFFFFIMSLLLTTLYSYRLFIYLNGLSMGAVTSFPQISLVTVTLSFVGILMGWVMSVEFFSLGFVSFIYKVMFPFSLLMSVMGIGMIKMLPNSQFVINIGGLNYFKADYYLYSYSRMGKGIFLLFDKGLFKVLFSFMKKMELPSQNTVFINGIIMMVLTMVIMFFMLL